MKKRQSREIGNVGTQDDKTKKKKKKKKLFLITYQEGSNHICQPDCLYTNPSAIYRKKAMMLFPELIQ